MRSKNARTKAPTWLIRYPARTAGGSLFEGLSIATANGSGSGAAGQLPVSYGASSGGPSPPKAPTPAQRQGNTPVAGPGDHDSSGLFSGLDLAGGDFGASVITTSTPTRYLSASAFWGKVQ